MNARDVDPAEVPPLVEKAVDAVRRRPTRNSKTRTAVIVGALVVVLVGLTALVVMYMRSEANNRAENAVRDDQIAKLAAGNGAQKQATDQANKKLTDNGLDPVPVPSPVTPTVGPVPPVPGEKGDTGPGPTPAQVAAAVAGYCQANRCAGEKGDPGVGTKGDKGDAPTAAQVAAAITAYCADSRCVGPRGETVVGDKGDKGDTGSSPTAAEVADAVNAYCADGRCVGAKGDPGVGEKGDKGDDGREVKGLECVDSRSIVTYSDDSTADVGACQTRGEKGDKGDDGEPGKDGRGITSLDCTDDQRLVVTYTDDTTDDVGTCG